MKEEPLIWGLPTLAGMRADLSSGLGSVLHWFCPAGGWGGMRVWWCWGHPVKAVASLFYQLWTSLAWDQALSSATV